MNIYMYVLITYDVDTTTPAGCRRLRRVAKCCQNYGQRVQNSVFECSMAEALFVKFKAQLSELIDPTKDSVRIYKLGTRYHEKIDRIGVETSFDVDGSLII